MVQSSDHPEGENDTSLLAAAREALQQRFGFNDFLPGQKEVLSDIFSGQNVVAVMPTGAGKSLLYQLPAVVMPGMVLVISPLISLMKDQVDSLRSKNIQAAFINSTLGSYEKRQIIEAMCYGHYQLIYVAPERLQSPDFRQAIRQSRVTMLAVDEAHCISQWGHDFRPDYLRIKDLRQFLKYPQTAALTATATPDVRHEIAQGLELQQWADHVAGFDRDNLYFEVRAVSSQKQKIEHIVATANRIGPSGIIYAGTRKNVERIEFELRQRKINAGSYHAGLSQYQRDQVQEDFMSDRLAIVAATNAFGMGIDKTDIRFVIHYDIPASIEAYYQEVGRAGRDRKASRCCLLFNYADTRICRFFIEESHPTPAVVEQIWQAICHEQLVPSPEELAARLNLSSVMTTRYALAMLERARLIARAIPGDFYLCTPNDQGLVALKEILASDGKRKQHDEEKLAQMIRYAYFDGCRRIWILDYFGDHKPCAGCQACDNCDNQVGRQQVTGDKLIEVLKALSAVARLNGRMGKLRIAQVLIASRRKQIIDWELHKLPTYGALAYLPQAEVCDLLEALIAAGYIQVRLKESKYPLLSLTRAGNEVMMQKAPCYLVQSAANSHVDTTNPQTKSKCAASKDKQAVVDYDKELYEKLASCRKSLADELGRPAFIVFHNSTLQQMAARKPRSLEEMLQVPGVGQMKLERYGKEFLQIIEEHG